MLANLNALVRDTVELYHRNASGRNIGLHAIVSDETLTANVDPAWIQQALGNVIDDALHANLKSDVRAEFSPAQLPPEEAGELAQIEIRRSGSCFLPEQVNDFDRFYQAKVASDLV